MISCGGVTASQRYSTWGIGADGTHPAHGDDVIFLGVLPQLIIAAGSGYIIVPVSSLVSFFNL